MTTTTGEPTTAPPAVCTDCGHPTRALYVIGGDIVVPGLWSCTACPAGRREWPVTRDYRCQ